MTIGPVQLLVLGFDHPDFEGEVVAELERLKDDNVVRVIDALVVQKDATGQVTGAKGSQLSGAETARFGALVGSLIGLGAGGVAGAQAGAEIGAEAAEERGGVFGQQAWDVLAGIPEDSAAALVLLEHRWAVPLRDAVARAGGFRLASELISPLDLVSIGMVGADEAERLAATERDAS